MLPTERTSLIQIAHNLYGFLYVLMQSITDDNRKIIALMVRVSDLVKTSLFHICNWLQCRSQWPRGLRRRSTAARLLRLWVRIPPRAWMFVCCECCVLSGRGLCDGLIIRSEESCRLWRVVVCDQETS